MSTLILYFFATILCAHHACGMIELYEEIKSENSDDQKEEEEDDNNNSKSKLKPKRIVLKASTNDSTITKVNEVDDSVVIITHKTYCVPPVECWWYNLTDNKLIKRYKSNDYIASSHDINSTQNGPILFLCSKDKLDYTIPKTLVKNPRSGKVCPYWLKKQCKPLYTYSVQTEEEPNKINVMLRPEENFDLAVTNTDNGKYKAITLWNMDTLEFRSILINEKNKVTYQFTSEKTIVSIALSPSGDRFIQGIEDTGLYLYDITNKEKPTLIATYKDSVYGWFHQIKNVFCDWIKIYNGVTGKEIMTCSDKKRFLVIGFSQNSFTLYDVTNKEIFFYTKKCSDITSLPLLHIYTNPRSTTINNGKNIALYNTFGVGTTTIYLYPLLKKRQNCIIN